MSESTSFWPTWTDSYLRGSARALQSQIEAVDNVATVTFISRDEARASYLQDMGAEDDLYSSLPSSVFRHRFSISVLISACCRTPSEGGGHRRIADYSAALMWPMALSLCATWLPLSPSVWWAVLLVISCSKS